ncbi:MAG: hypothetical protein ABI837_11915 [Acidobacteriota bacterium]
MREDTRNARNAARTAELYVVVRRRIVLVLRDLETVGLHPRIQEAWRSPADQLRAYETGHSKLKFGFHNVTGATGKPEALAADILDDDNPLNPRPSYLLQLAATAERHGMATGIRWGLPAAFAGAIDAAIAAHA